jgi:hypothetical protein
MNALIQKGDSEVSGISGKSTESFQSVPGFRGFSESRSVPVGSIFQRKQAPLFSRRRRGLIANPQRKGGKTVCYHFPKDLPGVPKWIEFEIYTRFLGLKIFRISASIMKRVPIRYCRIICSIRMKTEGKIELLDNSESYKNVLAVGQIC